MKRPVTDRPLLLGLIGSGIGRSLTPAMQEEEARLQGLRLHYQLIDLDRVHEFARISASHPDNRSGGNGASGAALLSHLIESACVMGFAGLNITFPCKQAVIPLLDELSDEARAMGAVNTVLMRGGRLVGHNTDGSGWAWGFRRALPQADLSKVVLLGAGGAGSAIAHAVLRLGAARLTIVDQDIRRAQALAANVSPHYPNASVATNGDVALALGDASGLIHATPTGMDKSPGLPITAALLRPSIWVSEIVYFPLQTALLKAARTAGCPVVDGGGMAVGQAVGAFELFTGRRADPDRMRAHFLSLIGAARQSEEQAAAGGA